MTTVVVAGLPGGRMDRREPLGMTPHRRLPRARGRFKVPDRRFAGNIRRRRRLKDRDVERLNRLAWWDRPPAEIEAALAILERGGPAELERQFSR